MPFGFGALKSFANNAVSAATNVAAEAAKVAETAATAAASTVEAVADTAAAVVPPEVVVLEEIDGFKCPCLVSFWPISSLLSID